MQWMRDYHKRELMVEQLDHKGTQSILADVEDNTWYSALLYDQETICYFFDDHEIGLEPMKTTGQ